MNAAFRLPECGSPTLTPRPLSWVITCDVTSQRFESHLEVFDSPSLPLFICFMCVSGFQLLEFYAMGVFVFFFFKLFF